MATEETERECLRLGDGGVEELRWSSGTCLGFRLIPALWNRREITESRRETNRGNNDEGKGFGYLLCDVDGGDSIGSLFGLELHTRTR